LEQKRAREQPERYTREETVRGPREERLGSTVRFCRVLDTALGFSFASTRPAVNLWKPLEGARACV